jgi:uncharacterized protein (TIGR02757 family)
MQTSNDILFLLNDRAKRYNSVDFIETDPIQIPHRFNRKEDIEIAAFLTATIAWGQRKSIINNANRLMELMDHSPYEFITQGNPETDWQMIQHFVHRTFNGTDCLFYLTSLRNIYLEHGGLETVFTKGFETDQTVFASLIHFRKVFL